jgi:predicted NBD/HSP70 family sugar kinase
MDEIQTKPRSDFRPNGVLVPLPLGTVGRTTNQHARQRNLQAALQCIYREPVVSRADISRLTGLTRATVSNLVAQLVRDGLVQELGPGTSSGGKPPTLLALDPDGRQIAALDLSRRPFRGALFDLRGQVVRRVTGRGAPRVPARLEEVFRLVETLADTASAPLLGIGVGTPGIVDLEGCVIEAANLGWHGIHLQSELAERFRVPVRVANDAHVAALAEFGSRPGVNVAVVKIGVGIGAGIVVDGRLYRGNRPAAGEIGHLRVVDDGLPCTCGNSGCLETTASVPSILRRAVEASGRDVSPETLPWDAAKAAELLGARAVRGAITDAGRSLGGVLAHLVAILDLHHVVLALELENAEDLLLEAVREEVRGRILPTLGSAVEFARPELGPDLVLAGAAALVLSDRLGVVWQ